MYDVVIIGAGVSGAACARELMRYQLSVCVLERAADVCCGTTKANSGIVHSGIDAHPGTLKAEMNLKGNALMEDLSKELDFYFIRNGSLIISFSDEDRPQLEALYQQGLENGVEGIRIVEKEELHQMEPALSDEAVAGIYCPTGGIVDPFGLNIALAENAATNGAEFRFNTEVTNAQRREDHWVLSTTKGDVEAKVVVNAAGVYADVFHNMATGEGSTDKLTITARKGEYCLLDTTAGKTVSNTIFQLPTKMGKGILVTPTTHGNLLIGPTATDIDDKEGTNTTAEGLDHVIQAAMKSVPGLPRREIITSFTGLRAHDDRNDFVIEELKDAPGFVDCAGIESPGLTSAPAIGQRVAQIVAEILKPQKNEAFNGKREGIVHLKHCTLEERSALIRKNPAYGNIVCRCEDVTEGEIMDAIHRPLGATTLDGVKRRTTQGMGRCQAGFCTPRTVEILARELGVSPLSITKNGGSSFLLQGKTKEAKA